VKRNRSRRKRTFRSESNKWQQVRTRSSTLRINLEARLGSSAVPLRKEKRQRQLSQKKQAKRQLMLSKADLKWQMCRLCPMMLIRSLVN